MSSYDDEEKAYIEARKAEEKQAADAANPAASNYDKEEQDYINAQKAAEAKTVDPASSYDKEEQAYIDAQKAQDGSSIPTENQFQNQQDKVGKFHEMLNQPLNVAMSAFAAGAPYYADEALTSTEPWKAVAKAATEAYQKKRFTTVQQMVDATQKGKHAVPIWQNMGASNDSMMKPDPNRPGQNLPFDVTDIPGTLANNVDWGDVPDAIRNTALGIAADPVMAAVGPVVKVGGAALGAAARGAGALMEGAAKATNAYYEFMGPEGEAVRKSLPWVERNFGKSANELSASVGKYLSGVSNKKAGIAALGGLAGAAATGPDSDAGDYAKNIAAGATGAAAVGAIYPPAAKVIKKGTDAIADSMAVWLKGSEFKDLSAQSELMKEGAAKVAPVFHDIIQGFNKAIDGKSVDTVRAAQTVMADLTSEHVARRNAVGALSLSPEASVLDKATTPTEELFQAVGPMPPRGTVDYNVWKNNLDAAVHSQMIADGTIEKAVASKGAEVAGVVTALSDENTRIVSKLNQEIYHLPDGQPDAVTGKGIYGLPYHTEEILNKELFVKPEDFKPIDEAFAATKREVSPTGPLKKAMGTSRGEAIGTLDPQESRTIYARQMAMNWTTNAERNAMRFMADYRAAPGAGTVQGIANGALGTFDKATHFMKYNMLMPSTSWVKNNFPDNLKKAYMTNGILGWMDAATLGAAHKGLIKDVWANMGENYSVLQKSPYTKDLIKYGILDTNLYKEVDLADAMLPYVKTPEQIAEMKALSESKNPLVNLASKVGKLTFAPFKLVGDKIISPIGRLTESTAKATTYINTLKMLTSDPKYVEQLGGLEAAKAMSAKITQDTFFDYSKATEFERMFAKRLFPFYTFFKNNAIYYAKAMEDPTKIARLAATERVPSLMHSLRQPDQEEQKGMPKYLQDAGAMVSGYKPGGGMNVYANPNNSLYDAMKVLEDPTAPDSKSLFMEKMHPMIREPIFNWGLGRDTFTGGEALPSRNKNNEKPMFSTGNAHLKINEGIEKITSPGPLRDFLERIMGTYGVVRNDKGEPVSTRDEQVLENQISPLAPGSLLWPKPWLNQTVGNWERYQKGTHTPGEILNNLLNDSQYTTVSPANFDWNMTRYNRDNKALQYEQEYKDKMRGK